MPQKDYRAMRAELTAERAGELLAYDPETGTFLWRASRRGVCAGDVAGTVNGSGHRSIRVDGHRYYAHRLAWLLSTGEWPKDQIDHINGARSDNRIANLRDVCQSTNMQNQRKATAQNRSSKYLGVSFFKRHNKWQSTIRVNGKQVHLGYFDTEEEASATYLTAKREHHPGCTI